MLTESSEHVETGQDDFCCICSIDTQWTYLLGETTEELVEELWENEANILGERKNILKFKMCFSIFIVLEKSLGREKR